MLKNCDNECEIDYQIECPKWWNLNLKECLRYKELFFFFAWRDIKIRYNQAILGIAWALLQPMTLMVIFSIFWSKAIKIDTGLPYPLFAYIGLIFWMLFSSGMTNSANSMIENANIIKKVYFPRIIIPVSAVIVSIFDFTMTLILSPFLLLYYRVDLNIFKLLVLLPLSLIITFTSSLGLGLILGSLNIKYRDFRYLIPFLLQSLFFLTPIFFPISILESNALKTIISINPMVTAISLARCAVANEPVDWEALFFWFFFSIFILIVGLFFFRKTEIDCADVL
ncbi:MAG: ABC transporter permease [Candidatus Riflebacteria bacterium]|nr:ABC transporter permease [Candidatus Riflebacteria bacterium]